MGIDLIKFNGFLTNYLGFMKQDQNVRMLD